MAQDLFPILFPGDVKNAADHKDMPKAIPWKEMEKVRPHAEALLGASLEEVAASGGVSCAEAVACLNEKQWQSEDKEKQDKEKQDKDAAVELKAWNEK